jgi:hypothetical protein
MQLTNADTTQRAQATMRPAPPGIRAIVRVGGDLYY